LQYLKHRVLSFSVNWLSFELSRSGILGAHLAALHKEKTISLKLHGARLHYYQPPFYGNKFVEEKLSRETVAGRTLLGEDSKGKHWA
jgi:hypothetical protein